MDEDSDENTLADRFEGVHSHLEHVDRNLDLITEQIEREVEVAMDDLDPEVAYNIDAGTVEARLPHEKVVQRLNRMLEPPFFVELENHDTIVVKDIRDTLDDELDESLLAEARTERDQIQLAKTVTASLEDAYEDGAPEQQVIKALQYSGLTPDGAEDLLLTLKTDGEIYEPATGRLRTT
jgi:hypothetical protein